MPETIYNQYTAQAQSIVSAMTLAEKIGQMLLPPTHALTINYAPNGMVGAKAAWKNSPKPSSALGDALGFSAISRFHLGAVLQPAMGGLHYSGDLPADQRLDQWQTLAQTLQLYQTKELPLFLGTDAIHGNQHVVGAVLFPHNIGLGATHNPSLVNLVAAWTSYDVALSGFNWVYMPTVAIAQDYRWGRTYESFGSENDVVFALAQNYVAGLQGIKNGQITGCLACVKHFIADGATQAGVDEGGAHSPDLATLWGQNGAGYAGATALKDPIAQAGSAMVSYSSLNEIPMHFGGAFDVLTQFRGDGVQIGKNSYQLAGFVVSDYEGVSRAAWKYNTLHKTTLTLAEALAKSINAGIDMIMMSNAAYTNPLDVGTFQSPPKNKSPSYYTNLQEVVTAMTEAVDTGFIPLSRIDDAALRIIRTKLAMTFVVPSPPNTSEATVSLQAAEQSMVLLKNSDNLLPLTAKNIQHVFLMGSYDDIGIQNGGWTVNWHGQKGNEYWTDADRKNASATSVIDGIQNTLPGARIVAGESDVLNHLLADVNSSNSVAVIVIGEFPYAEYMGDVGNQNPWYRQGAAQGICPSAPPEQNSFLGIHFTEKQAQAIKNLKSAGVPIVTVLFSGRPIVITEGSHVPLPISDAFLAAFLPGTSGGQAISNILFGAFRTTSVSSVINGKTYTSNTLPLAWPASMKEVAQNNPSLYPVGYGLSTQ